MYGLIGAPVLLWKYPNTEFFLVHIFLYLDWPKSLYSVQIRENTDQKKPRIWIFGDFSRSEYNEIFNNFCMVQKDL